MAFEKETLAALLDRAYANYTSRLRPIAQTPRYNLMKVLSAVDAGMEHQLLGDLSFLADQIFPDTATGSYLRAHWSDRVPVLSASSAAGTVRQPGVKGAAVPAGLIYSSDAGKRYYTTQSYTVGSDGYAYVSVTAAEAGSASCLDEGAELSVVSALTTGLASTAAVYAGGISGGVDAESDEEYLSRVLMYLRNTTRYGNTGDFAAWAVDSSTEVTKAFEIKNFGIFGALLVQVINGNQVDGIKQVAGLSTVRTYIEQYAPPVLFTVRTPELVPVNPVISLDKSEDTAENRTLVLSRLQVYLQAKAVPGITFTQEQFHSIITDGVTISSSTLTLTGGKTATTILQYPVMGTITWN